MKRSSKKWTLVLLVLVLIAAATITICPLVIKATTGSNLQSFFYLLQPEGKTFGYHFRTLLLTFLALLLKAYAELNKSQLLFLSNIPALIICLLTGLAIITRYVVRKNKRYLLTTRNFLCILALAAFCIHLLPLLSHLILSKRVTTYHYFLGSKYFKELGYYGLYRYSALADQESDKPQLGSIRTIRHLEDLTHNSIEDEIKIAKSERWTHFSQERWTDFKADWIPMARDSRAWPKRLNDHGFNPSPAWNIVPGAIAQFVRTDNIFVYTVVRLIDLYFFILILFIIYKKLGLDQALLVFIFITTAVRWYYPHSLVDTFFQYQWFFSLLLAVLVYHLGHKKLSGIFLAYSVSVRIFPLFFTIGPFLNWLKQARASRKIMTSDFKFLISFCSALLLFGALGLTQGKGLKSSKQFLENISQHAQEIRFHGNKFGLKRLSAIQLNEILTPEYDKGKRLRIFQEQRFFYYLSMLIILGLTCGAMLCRVENKAWIIPLAVACIFVITTTSRYYYLMLAVFLIPPRKYQNSIIATFTGAYIFLMHSSLFLFPYKSISGFNLGNLLLYIGMISIPATIIIKEIGSNRLKKSSEKDIQVSKDTQHQDP